MHILLVGQSSTITTTIQTMLQSKEDWSVKLHSNVDTLTRYNREESKFDLLMANLEDFTEASTKVVSQICSHFPDTPLLAIHSYLNKTLITPILRAGATGYIQNDISEHMLIKAAEKVASGIECVIAETT